MSTHVIQVKVYSTITAQQEVTQDVDPLDGELITVVCFEEPWIFVFDECPRVFNAPQLCSSRSVSSAVIFCLFALSRGRTYLDVPIRVGVDACPTCGFPMRW